jgi:hypothetical protein
MFKSITLLILIVLSLGACSTKPTHNKGAQKTFSTEIYANGSKRFVVAIVNSVSQGQHAQGKQKRSDKQDRNKGGSKRGGEGGGKGKGQERSDSNEPQYGRIQNNTAESEEDKRNEIIELLNEKLDETGYCRHGYIELDYIQMRGISELTGECQESASEEDKQRWE